MMTMDVWQELQEAGKYAEAVRRVMSPEYKQARSAMARNVLAHNKLLRRVMDDPKQRLYASGWRW